MANFFKENRIFSISATLAILSWIGAFSAYYAFYVHQKIDTVLPNGGEARLEYIKSLETFPELNDPNYGSGTFTNEVISQITMRVSQSGATYESCENTYSNPDAVKMCKNTFVAKALDELVSKKGFVKKEVCEEIEKRFGKNDQRDRCYMHYGTVMGDMTKNNEFCQYLPSQKERGSSSSAISPDASFFKFDEKPTRENCEFIVFYATLGSDEYNGTYLDKVKKSDDEEASTLYQKTLNKFGTYNYVTRNKDPKEYSFRIPKDSREFDKSNYQILKDAYSQMKSVFVIQTK